MFPIVFHFGSIPIFRHVFRAVFLGGGWVDISSANRSWWVGLIHEFVFRGPSTIIAWLDYSFASPSAGFRTSGFHFCGPNLVSSPIQLSFMMWRCPMRERFSWLCQLFGWLFDVACDVACDWWIDIYNANIKHHDSSEPFWTAVTVMLVALAISSSTASILQPKYCTWLRKVRRSRHTTIRSAHNYIQRIRKIAVDYNNLVALVEPKKIREVTARLCLPDFACLYLWTRSSRQRKQNRRLHSQKHTPQSGTKLSWLCILYTQDGQHLLHWMFFVLGHIFL